MLSEYESDAMLDPFRYEPRDDEEIAYWQEMQRGADELGIPRGSPYVPASVLEGEDG